MIEESIKRRSQVRRTGSYPIYCVSASVLTSAVRLLYTKKHNWLVFYYSSKICNFGKLRKWVNMDITIHCDMMHRDAEIWWCPMWKSVTNVTQDQESKATMGTCSSKLRLTPKKDKKVFVFLFFTPLCVNSRECYALNSQEMFLKHSNSPSGTNNHVTAKVMWKISPFLISDKKWNWICWFVSA